LKEINMQLALRPYFSAAGVAVLGAGFIYVTPHATPHLEQRAVQLVAAEDFTELFSPIDGELSGVLPALSDVSGTFADGASSTADLELLDPAFWQEFWNALLEPNMGESPWLMLTGALEQLPVIGPLMEGFGLFVVFPVALLLGEVWSEIAQAFGFEPYAAAAEALPAGAATALVDGGASFTDALAVLDPATMIQDVSAALDPSAVMSALDFSPIADMSTVVDPGLVADIGAWVDAGTISDLGGMLTSLIP
jgi:hypothetical protein